MVVCLGTLFLSANVASELPRGERFGLTLTLSLTLYRLVPLCLDHSNDEFEAEFTIEGLLRH